MGDKRTCVLALQGLTRELPWAAARHYIRQRGCHICRCECRAVELLFTLAGDQKDLEELRQRLATCLRGRSGQRRRQAESGCPPRRLCWARPVLLIAQDVYAPI